MINVALVRGAYLNGFEGQNFDIRDQGIRLTGISSLRPIGTQVPFPVMRLPGITDFSGASNRLVKAVANRTLGDMHVLFGLERYAPDFDIFHTADPHYYYSYQLAKLRKAGRIKRLLVTSWETIPFNNESAGPKKRLKYFVMEHADKFLCYSDRAAASLRTEGVNGKRIEIIRLGVDIERFKPAHSAGNGRPLLLFVGRLVEEKGINDLYTAFKTVRTAWKGKPPVLRIVGDGPLKRELSARIRKDNLDESVRLESHSYREMPEVYREADVFILPSIRSKTWEEQYGMVLPEAMASGLPVVAYRSGAVPEVAGDAALYAREGDVAGLGHAIAGLASAKARTELGRIGRERARFLFDSRKTASRIAGLYRKLYYETQRDNPRKKRGI